VEEESLSSDEEESASESESSSMELDDDDSVENVVGWKPAKRIPKVEIIPIRSRNNQRQAQDGCSMNMFLSDDKTCRSCSLCGPDLYVREQCLRDRDTVCDWCLNPFPVRNTDFHSKCDDYIKVRREFLETIEGRSLEDRRRNSPLTVDEDDGDQQTLLHISAISISSADPNYWWKLEMLLEVCFYLALIALIFSVIRFLSRTKPYYRTINISPPMFDEADNKNIIQAAESIREKIGKKGYEKLEEFI
jgi:hypothetical protein